MKNLSEPDIKHMSYRLQLLGFHSYSHFLESQYWESKKRLCKMDYCKACLSRFNLVLHHTTYERLGMEYNKDLVTVCEDCHEGIHTLRNEIDSTIDIATMRFIEDKIRLSKETKEIRLIAKIKRKKKSKEVVRDIDKVRIVSRCEYRRSHSLLSTC